MQRNFSPSSDPAIEFQRWERGRGEMNVKGHSPSDYNKPLVRWFFPEEESEWLMISSAARAIADFGHVREVPMISVDEPIFEAATCKVPNSLPSVKDFFASRVYGIPGVREIYYREDEDGEFNFWVVGNELEREHKFDIYDIEADTMEEFSNLELDFRVISLPQDQVPSEIPSDAELVHSE